MVEAVLILEFAMPFLPDGPVVLTYVLAVIILTLTPGPDMLLFLSKTLTQGRKAGFAAFLGAAAGLFVHTMLAAVGLSALLAASDSIFAALKLAGGVYLLWLAYDMVKNGVAPSLASEPHTPEPLFRLYMKGLAINLLNPKIMVFFITFLPQFVAGDDAMAPYKLLFLGMLFVAVAAPICFLLILFAEAVAHVLTRSRRTARLIQYIFACALGGFAIKMLLARAN